MFAKIFSCVRSGSGGTFYFRMHEEHFCENQNSTLSAGLHAVKFFKKIVEINKVIQTVFPGLCRKVLKSNFILY